MTRALGDELDLGTDEADIDLPARGARFDPEPAREKTRGVLAGGSFALLTVTVLTTLGVVASGTRTWNEMQGVAASVLPAVLSVVGTTLGFYFGTKSRESE